MEYGLIYFYWWLFFSDPECSNRVKQLFIDMKMLEIYREFAYGKYDTIRALIATAECEDPIKNVLYKTTDLLFHRSMFKI